MRVHTTALKEGIRRTKEFERKGLAAFSVNVGTKCGHDCLYCSTGATLRTHASFKNAGESAFGLGYAIVDPTTADRVADDAARKRNRGLIQLCTTVDAWSPEAQNYKLGRQCLEAILAEPDWTVRILTKNAAVVQDFDLIEKYRDRVTVGLSLTAPPEYSAILDIVEPNASPIQERMEALAEAHRRGLRTYGMLCPLLPGISNQPQRIDELLRFVFECGAEEVFIEPINGRGDAIGGTAKALREAGYSAEADQVDAVRTDAGWSRYARQLLQDVQDCMRKRDRLAALRFLLYRSRLTKTCEEWIKAHEDGVRWLGKPAVPESVNDESAELDATALSDQGVESPITDLRLDDAEPDKLADWKFRFDPEKLDRLAARLHGDDFQEETLLRERLAGSLGRMWLNRFELGWILNDYRRLYKGTRSWEHFCQAIGCKIRTARRLIEDYEAAKSVTQALRDAAAESGYDLAARKNRDLLEQVVTLAPKDVEVAPEDARRLIKLASSKISAPPTRGAGKQVPPEDKIESAFKSVTRVLDTFNPADQQLWLRQLITRLKAHYGLAKNHRVAVHPEQVSLGISN